MQVEQLRAFLVAAEEPSLRRAALRLHLSQAALSERIARLERSLGVRLLERGPIGTCCRSGACTTGLPRSNAAGEPRRPPPVRHRPAPARRSLRPFRWAPLPCVQVAGVQARPLIPRLPSGRLRSDPGRAAPAALDRLAQPARRAFPCSGPRSPRSAAPERTAPRTESSPGPRPLESTADR
ncbi:helix-turn-helix domain-containing protein [Kineococcus indalonis]|uniref:helix-turn-helix domain-containing protein n=1 Tax=Kineococcus indalonis TaxID=2696566 RepID=UPI00196AA7C0|nr:LysR family transcriptional regulator [Kineococcus indalonis]